MNIVESNIYTEMLHHTYIIPGFSVHVFINDFLMAIFFLVVGCEIKKEIVEGYLSNIKKASLPIVAAVLSCVLALIATSLSLKRNNKSLLIFIYKYSF